MKVDVLLRKSHKDEFYLELNCCDSRLLKDTDVNEQCQGQISVRIKTGSDGLTRRSFLTPDL